MKKLLTLSVLVSMFVSGTALADVLPEGKKSVTVCAYFNNTASVLDEMAIFAYEYAPDGSFVSRSSLIANECLSKAYKFNTIKVYGLTAEHALETADHDPYVPEEDLEAYPTNIELEIGEILVDANSNVERIENEYTIAELDLVNKMLLVTPIQTKKYFNNETDPEITVGSVTSISGNVEEDLEDAFTDVDATNKYYTAVKYLKDEGIIGGYEDGSYKPENTINRAEFTKIIMGAVSTSEELQNCAANYTMVEDYNVSLFTDVNFEMVGGNEPVWYFDYVCMAKLNEVIQGYDDGSFKPAQDINFVEAAKIITKAMGYQMMTDTDPWYKGYVMELENHNAIPTTIAGFDHKITRGEMAEIAYRLRAEVTNLTSLTYEGLE
ncbi:hypothetical protein C0416_03845 [bacterium]|nr:hypothetical protein [bacterium]